MKEKGFWEGVQAAMPTALGYVSIGLACGIIGAPYVTPVEMGLMSLSTPDKLLCDLAAHRRDHPDSALRQLHFYPLGGFETTVNWLRAIEAGKITITADGFVAD